MSPSYLILAHTFLTLYRSATVLSFRSRIELQYPPWSPHPLQPKQSEKENCKRKARIFRHNEIKCDSAGKNQRNIPNSQPKRDRPPNSQKKNLFQTRSLVNMFLRACLLSSCSAVFGCRASFIILRRCLINQCGFNDRRGRINRVPRRYVSF